MMTIRTLGVAAALWCAPVWAATIIVPDMNPSVRDAVMNAAPGDVIQVRAGIYFEPVRIEDGQTGLVIEGLGEGRPILQLQRRGDGISIRGVDGVTVRDFIVRGGTRGVRVEDANGVVIEHVASVAARQEAFLVKRASGTTLTAVEVDYSGGRGIRIDRASATTITGVAGAFGNGREGLRADRALGLTVQSSVFGGNRGDGIRVHKSENVTLDGNVASGNGHSGIRVQASPPVASVTDLTNAGNAATGNGKADFRAD
ncbi:MAG: right-handed parallel beta-helix repeat-containing protein [Thermodesulfobacteriota bacterium]